MSDIECLTDMFNAELHKMMAQGSRRLWQNDIERLLNSGMPVCLSQSDGSAVIHYIDDVTGQPHVDEYLAPTMLK